MPLEPAITGATLQHLGWVLLHFLWQGALLAALFWFANFCLRRRSANARYVVGCAALLLMAAAPVVTFTILRAASDRASNLLLSGEQVNHLIAMPFLGDAGSTAAPRRAVGGGTAPAAASPALSAWKARIERSLPWLS